MRRPNVARDGSTVRMLGAALTLALSFATSAAAAEKVAAQGPAATPAGLSLATRAARFPRVDSARAQFSQEREVSLVEEVLHARGTIVLKAPDSMRLELSEPERVTIIAAGATVTVLDADDKPVPVPAEMSGFAQFGRALNELMLGRKAPEQFAERWQDADTVTLAPENPAAPFSEITMRFPPDRPLPREIVLRERNGDRTTIRLEALEMKAAAPAPAKPAR